MGKDTKIDEKAQQWLSEHSVARLLEVSLSKLRQDRFHRRGLPYYKVGKSVRYLLADILAYMAKRRINVETAA